MAYTKCDEKDCLLEKGHKGRHYSNYDYAKEAEKDRTDKSDRFKYTLKLRDR